MQQQTFLEPTNLLQRDGEVLLFPHFFPEALSARYFSALQNDIQWKHEPITIFGKSVMQPRLTAWYGDAGKEIRYSGITMIPRGWTTELLEIKKAIEPLAGVSFTSVLLNQYRNGQDSVGWHRDNEKELGPQPVIGSVSFGESRKFVFRHRDDHSQKVTVILDHGSFLLMRGDTQIHWDHAIPKSSRELDTRINLTFRVMKN